MVLNYQRRLLLFLLSSLVTLFVSAQSNWSSTTLKFIAEEEIDSILFSKLSEAGKINGVQDGEIKSRMNENDERIAATLHPLIHSRFLSLDNQYQLKKISPGSTAYLNARRDYLDNAADIVSSLLGGTNAFSMLIAKNSSDRILSFKSDVTVGAEGKLAVVENIKIYNGNGQTGDIAFENVNNDIQRGIVRDFPTGYVNKKGFNVKTGFSLKRVLLDGKDVPYIKEYLSNGTRIKVGEHDVMLPEGTFTYTFEYETDRQIIFHETKDELYWNVNGNGWVFTIDTVSCIIHFPTSATIKENQCYTGAFGSTDQNCISRAEGNNISFTTTKQLNSWEGLTVAAAIDKGIIAAPGKTASFVYWLKDNYIIPLLIALLALLFIYDYRVWKAKGKDPETGVIIPQFAPPDGLTPADVGFIAEQKYGPHLFAAALIDFAVKKNLVIEVEEKGSLFKSVEYNFNRPTNSLSIPDTTATYGFNADQFYGQQAQRGKYNSTLKAKNDALQKTLENRFVISKGKKNSWDGLFSRNRRYTVLGFLIIIASVILSFVFSTSGFTTTIAFFVAACILVMITVHVFFSFIISAYTEKGRAIADHIAGFKMYLNQAEQHVFDQLTPPEKTLDLFEKYLPYAIALKVENAWAEQFHNIMTQAIAEGYRPSYYSGSYGSFGRSFSMAGMSQGIASGLSSTISSASTPPSKSGGGSGGGGFSGGGGGGGGGGGW